MITVLTLEWKVDQFQSTRWSSRRRATVPQPYQSLNCDHTSLQYTRWREGEEGIGRGWPQTTDLWHPQFNVERTNPLWR